jgi:hypothetical protein
MLDLMLCCAEFIPKFHNLQNDCNHYAVNNISRNVPVLPKLADSDIQVIPQNVCQTLGGYSLAYFE